jgi:hypothetical protein
MRKQGGTVQIRYRVENPRQRFAENKDTMNERFPAMVGA